VVGVDDETAVLAAILPESGIGEPQFRHVPIDLIGPNPDQPRTEFDPASIESLAASVANAGVVQPVILRPVADGRYELIAGERRWQAARRAGMRRIPALLREADELTRMIQVQAMAVALLASLTPSAGDSAIAADPRTNPGPPLPSKLRVRDSGGCFSRTAAFPV